VCCLRTQLIDRSSSRHRHTMPMEITRSDAMTMSHTSGRQAAPAYGGAQAGTRSAFTSGSPKASSLPISIPNALHKKIRRKQEDAYPRVGSVVGKPIYNVDKENDLMFSFAGSIADDLSDLKQIQEDKAHLQEVDRRLGECEDLVEKAQRRDRALVEVVTSLLKMLPRDAQGSVSLESLAQALQEEGYKAELKSNKRGTGKATSWSSSHTHIIVEVPSSSSSSGVRSVVVDPGFRSQFVLARPTKEYTQLLEVLPDVFVGCKDTMRDIIEFVSNRAAESFHSSNMTLPPWRERDAMLAKWCLNESATQSSGTYACRSAYPRWPQGSIGNRIKC